MSTVKLLCLAISCPRSQVNERRSVFRIFVLNSADVWESELSHVARLFAVEVPGAVDFSGVAKLLAEGTGSGRWEYEEGAFRHSLQAE